jgi:hypothetical protein
MALTDIRSLVAELSGRADLNVTPYTLIDALINKGQRLLDSLVTSGKLKARYFKDISIGQIMLPIVGCRAINEVWVSGSEGRSKLIKVDISQLREYMDDDPASMDTGEPAYYAPAVVRAIGDSATKPETLTPSSFSQHWALDDVKYNNDWYTYNGVLWAPPADQAYTMEVWGLFNSIALDATNVTKSFWTENEAMLLTYAALYWLEVSYRNTEGAKDWMNAITGDTSEMIKDMIEEEISDIDSMQG